MRTEPNPLLTSNKIEMEQILKHLTLLTGFSEQDSLILRNSAPQTQQWVDEIVTEFYDTLFGYKTTARVFHEGERPERESILRRWYLEVTSGNFNDEFWQQQWRMGTLHNLRRVKSLFTLGMMSRVQQHFLEKCLQAFESPQALQVYGAFKRATDVIAGLVVESYQIPYGKMEKLVDDLQNIILPLSIALSTEQDDDQFLERILVETKSICNADAGTLYVRTEDDCLSFAIMLTDTLNIALGGTTGKEVPCPPLRLYDAITGEPNYHNVATHVALHGRSINIPDVYHAEGFDFSSTKEFDKENNYRSISSLTVPLKNHMNEVIGVLQLFNAQDPKTGQVIPFDSYQQLVVEALSSQAAIALNNRILLERQQELSKLQRDVQVGRQIQRDFLPDDDKLPQPEGWEIAARFQPALEVAGDFFDAFSLANNKVCIVIADVVDKGVGAALFMALSRSLLRAFAEQHRPLSWLDNISDGDHLTTDTNLSATRRRILLSAGAGALLAVKLTNNYIANYHGDMTMFATMFFGLLDPATGMLSYINGGHNAPVIIDSTGKVTARLTPTGPAVGMLPDMDFDIQQIKLNPGDLLMTFTDGVPDARSPTREFFGEDRLLSLLKKPFASATALLDRIEASLQAHIDTADQFDDITMLAVWRTPNSETQNNQAATKTVERALRDLIAD